MSSESSFYSLDSLDLTTLDSHVVEAIGLDSHDLHSTQQKEEELFDDTVSIIGNVKSVLRTGWNVFKKEMIKEVDNVQQAWDKIADDIKIDQNEIIPLTTIEEDESVFKRGFHEINKKMRNNLNKLTKPAKTITVDLSIDSLDSKDIGYLLKHRYSLWETQLAHGLVELIASNCYYFYLTICILIAIFMVDIEHSFPYKYPSDQIVDGILLFIFSLLMIDILLCCLTYRWYPFSFFWFLETLGTLSLLLDITSIYSGRSRHQTNVILTKRGGRTFHAAKILSLLRLSRVIQWIRITRLTRFAHIIRRLRETTQHLGIINDINHNQEIKNNDDDDRLSEILTRKSTHIEHNTHKIASQISQKIFTQIVIGLLALLCLIPLLSGISSESYKNISLTKDIIIDVYQNDNHLRPYLNDIVQLFLQHQNDINIVHLEINGTIFKDDREHHNHLRDSEIFFDDGQYDLYLWVDISEFIRFEHQMNIGFSLLVIIIFLTIIYGIIYSIDHIMLNPLHHSIETISEQLVTFQSQYPMATKIIQNGVITPLLCRVMGIYNDKELHKKAVTVAETVVAAKFKNKVKTKLRNTITTSVPFKQDKVFQQLFSVESK